MKQIKIDATESTNDYLKQMLRQGPLEDGTLVRTLNQTKGRGQRGADWFFESDKSLAISVLKTWSAEKQPDAFQVQWVVCCAVLKVLSTLGQAEWHIKWPNDIMADGKKVAGLLIEHQFKGHMQSSVIGIGLNVNNTVFPELPHAASLSQILKSAQDLEKLSDELSIGVYQACQGIRPKDLQRDLAEFNAHLFLKNTPASFADKKDNVFQGRIQQVNKDGQLMVQTSQGVKGYNVGEIKLLLDLL